MYVYICAVHNAKGSYAYLAVGLTPFGEDESRSGMIQVEQGVYLSHAEAHKVVQPGVLQTSSPPGWRALRSFSGRLQVGPVRDDEEAAYNDLTQLTWPPPFVEQISESRWRAVQSVNGVKRAGPSRPNRRLAEYDTRYLADEEARKICFKAEKVRKDCHLADEEARKLLFKAEKVRKDLELGRSECIFKCHIIILVAILRRCVCAQLDHSVIVQTDIRSLRYYGEAVVKSSGVKFVGCRPRLSYRCRTRWIGCGGGVKSIRKACWFVLCVCARGTWGGQIPGK